MPLNPPEQINAPTRRNPLIHLIYGPPKIGKTTAICQIPGCYLLELRSTEGAGAEYVSYRGSAFDTLDELKSAIPTLRQWGTVEKRFKYLAIDTIDAIENWVEARGTALYMKSPAMREKEGSIINSVYELGYGRGHNLVRPEFKNLLAELGKCCEGLILVSHLKAGSFDKTEQVITAKDIDLPGKLANVACYAACAIGYFFMPADKPNERWITYVPKPGDTSCGGRCPHLSGKRFKISEQVGDTVKADWSKIYVDETPATTATPAQAAK